MVAESEETRREREIGELEQRFKEPVYEGNRGVTDVEYEEIEDGYLDAVARASEMMGHAPGVFNWSHDTGNPDAIGTFARKTSEASSGAIGEWFLLLADVMDEVVRTRGALRRTGD